MLPIRAPLIVAGQLYLNQDLNEYLVVTKNTRGQVSYSGAGFRGHLDDEKFLAQFPPVDPFDVEPKELRSLLAFCNVGTIATTGFFRDDK